MTSLRLTGALTLALLGLMPLPAQAQSFDCKLARTPDEILICQDRRLASLDERMAELYFRLRGRLGGPRREDLLISQRTWLRARKACPDVRCIEQIYDRRIAQLFDY